MTDNENDGGMSPDFNAPAAPQPAPEQDNFPSGERLLEEGIKHDSAYDAWAAQPPETPELNYNGPALVDQDWTMAKEVARVEHVAMVEEYRQEFHEEFAQHREHFNERAQPQGLTDHFNGRASPGHERE